MVEKIVMHHESVMPPFAIPTGFSSDAEYLKYLAYTRAKRIYGEPLPEEVDDRLHFELDIIKINGAERYFLFLQNVVSFAEKEFGALAGSGRGSTAGSLTAYCLGITKIDPLKHGLLFESFMSPDCQTIPDIFLDFDEEGLARVTEWLKQRNEKEYFRIQNAFRKEGKNIERRVFERLLRPFSAVFWGGPVPSRGLRT